jgi:hypothetical protein
MSILKSSISQKERFFNPLPMTDFCKNQNINMLVIGPFQGPGAEDSKACHIRIIRQDYLG